MHATANRNSILQNNCISYSKRYSNSYSNSRSANFYGKNCGNSYGNSVGYGYSNRCNQLFGTSSSSTTKVIVTKATTPSTANSFVKIWNRVVSRLSIVFLSGASPVIAGGFLSGGLHAITGKIAY